MLGAIIEIKKPLTWLSLVNTGYTFTGKNLTGSTSHISQPAGVGWCLEHSQSHS